MEQHPQHGLIITGHGMAGSVAACLTLRLIKEAGAQYVSRIRCITFGQVPVHLPQGLIGSQFQHVPQMKNRFISYILPSDSVPLQVSLLLTEVDNSTADISEDDLQQRLSSIFLSHVMSSPRASSAWSNFLQAQQVDQDLRIAPVGEIYSFSGRARDEVTGRSWLDFAKQQVSELKTEEAHAVHGVRSLLDYSVQFGPFLRSIMKERSSTVSLRKLGAHLHVDRVQVLPVGPQDVVVRMQGENLGVACHSSLQVQNGGTSHRATTGQFLAPDVWNAEHGFSGTIHQASWADLIVRWSVPVAALEDECAMMTVRVEGVLSDVHEHFVKPSLVGPADREDRKRWSGELDELQTEDRSLSSTSRSSHLVSEDALQVSRGLRSDAASVRSDGLRSEGSAAKKKKSSALELENKKLKKQLEEQTATSIELSRQLALRSELSHADAQPLDHAQNERDDHSGTIAKIREVDQMLTALQKMFVNLPMQAPVVTLESRGAGGKAMDTNVDAALNDLMNSAHEFRNCVQNWMEHFTTVLSLSKDEIMQLFEDQHKSRVEVRTLFQALQSLDTENSFLKKMVHKMRVKLGQQEAQVHLIREQSSVIAMLNDLCRVCLEELGSSFAKESHNEQIQRRYSEIVEDTQSKSSLIESLAKKRDQLEQQLRIQEDKMQEQTTMYRSNALRLHAAVQELRQIAKGVQENVQEPTAKTSTLRLQGAVQEVLEISHSLHGTVRGRTSGFSSPNSDADTEPPSKPIPPAPITSRFQEEIDVLQKALAAREKEMTSLKEHVQEMEAALAQAKASKTFLEQSKAELENRLLSSQASTAEAYEEILDWKKKMSEAHKVANESQNSAQNALQETAMLKKKIQEMKKQLGLKFSDVQWSSPPVSAARDASDYEEEIARLKQELHASAIPARKAGEYEEEISTLRQQLQESRAEHTMAENVYSKLREEWGQMRAELLQRDEMAKNANHKNQEADIAVMFQQVSSRIQEEVGRLRSELLGVEQDKTRDGDMLSYDALHAQLRTYEAQMQDATVKLKANEQELAEKKQAMDAIEESLGVHKELLSQSEKQVAIYRKQLAVRNVDADHANGNSTGQEAHAESTGEVENLKKTLQECEKALLMTKTALLESENQVARRDEEAKALRHSNAELKNSTIEEHKRMDLLPVCVALTIDRDFDETLGDPNRTAEFDRTLQRDVSAMLGVPIESVQVLCHQRGSIIAHVVLFSEDTDEAQRAPAQISQDLVKIVHQLQEGTVQTTQPGRCIRSAEVLGPIARPVCAAIQTTLAGLRCKQGSSARESIGLVQTSALIDKLEDTLFQVQAMVRLGPVVARKSDSASKHSEASEVARLRTELAEMTKLLDVERQNRRQEFWESVMLQVIEATDRELDRELGLVSPGRTVKRVREGLDDSQFHNGITTLEDIKRALPQLQDELLKRRRQIDLLKLSDKDKTARLEQLEAGMEALSVKLAERVQLQWYSWCLRLLHTNYRGWIRRELIDDVERNRAGEKVAAEMLASAEAKIDELGAALTEQTDQKVKLMETKESEAAILFNNEMISLKEQVDSANKEKEVLEEEACALKALLDKKTKDVAANRGMAANKCFLRYVAGVRRRVFCIWHEWMLQERSYIRKANTIMDRADRCVIRKVLSAWRGPWAQKMRQARHDAEQFVTSLMVCVEEAAKDADATNQLIQASI